MFHHAITGFLRAGAGDPNLSRTFSGSAPADKSQSIYIVVEPLSRTDNGEIQTGQVSTNRGFLMISVYGCEKHTLIDLEPYATKIKTLLSNRNFAITGYHVYGMLLKNELPLDFVIDPQGGENGVPSIKLMYSCGFGTRNV